MVTASWNGTARVWDAATGVPIGKPLQHEGTSGRVICSATHEIAGNRQLEEVSQPRDLADVDVGVVRAVLGVAESGSLLFTENELVVNTLAYLAQHLVVLLDPADIVSGLQDAYDRSEFLRADLWERYGCIELIWVFVCRVLFRLGGTRDRNNPDLAL